MFQMFPRMYSRPEPKQIGMGIGYWLAYVFFIPSVMSFVFAASTPDMEAYSIQAIAYWIINFLAVGLAFRAYLKDSMLSVRLYPKNFWRALAIALGVLLVLQIPMHLCGFGIRQWMYAETLILPLPVADMPYNQFSSPMWVIVMGPIWTGICTITIVPITMSCLYYAVGFAPFASERPWLGYIVVCLLAMLYRIVNAGGQEFLPYCLCVLPFHLCACWVYQQSDSIWGPIVFHAAANVIGIAGCLLTVPHVMLPLPI